MQTGADVTRLRSELWRCSQGGGQRFASPFGSHLRIKRGGLSIGRLFALSSDKKKREGRALKALPFRRIRLEICLVAYGRTAGGAGGCGGAYGAACERGAGYDDAALVNREHARAGVG